MQLRQTNSAITLLLSEYRAIFKSAYVKGLTAAVAVAAPMASAQAATPADPADLPDDPLDFSADSFDQNIAANGTGTVALDHGSSLTFVEGNATDPAPVAKNKLALRGKNSYNAENSFTSIANTVESGGDFDLRLNKQPYVNSENETQYVYYKNSEKVKDLKNTSSLNYDWDTQATGSFAKTAPVVVAGGKATAYDSVAGTGGTMISNETGGNITINGHEGLDNVALQIDASTDPALVGKTVKGMAQNLGNITVTNGTGIKVTGNGTTNEDVQGSRYIGFNNGTITVDSNVTNAPEAGKYSAVGMHFTGPTSGTADRKIQNNGTITVNNSGADSGAITAGMVVDGGADNVEIQNNGVIYANNSGSYAIFVGNASAEGVSDLTKNARVALGSKSQIGGIVKINNKTTLTVTDNKDSFVLQTFDEKLQGSEPSAGNSGIEMVLTNSNLTLESGSDVSVNNIKEYNNNKVSQLTVSEGADVTITANTDGTEGSNQPINLDNTVIINQGNTTVTGSQSLTTHKNLRNQGTWNVESGSTVNITGAQFSNYNNLNISSDSKFVGEELTNFVDNANSNITVDNSELKLSVKNDEGKLANQGNITIQNSGDLVLSAISNIGQDSQITNENSITVNSGSNAVVSADKFVNNKTFNISGQGSSAKFYGSQLNPLDDIVTDVPVVNFINNTNGEMNIADHSTLDITGKFENRSTFNATSGALVTIDTGSGQSFTNAGSGSIVIDNATVTVNDVASVDNRGSIELKNNANFSIYGADPTTAPTDKPFTFNNDNTVNVDYSTLSSNISKVVNNKDIIITNNGQADFTADDDKGTYFINNSSGTFTVSSGATAGFVGTLENRGTLNIESSGTAILSAGVGADATDRNTFSNTTNGKINIGADSSMNLEQVGEVYNGGKINVSGANSSLVIKAEQTKNLGAITVTDGGTFNVTELDPAAATPNAFNNRESGSVTIANSAQANFDIYVENNGTMKLDSGNAVFYGPGFANSTSGTVTVTSGSQIEFAGERFVNEGKIDVTDSTLGFRVDALAAHTENSDSSVADAKLSDLTGVTASGAVIELLGSNRTYTDANGETQQLVNHLSLNTVDELDSALSGSGNSLKLNNDTAVTVASGADSLTNETFNLFTADSGSAADIASRNVYFDGAATFNAGSSDKMITSANVTTNFGDLTLNKDAGNSATNLNLSGSNISIGHSLSSGEEGFNSLTVGNDSTLTFNPDNLSPVYDAEPLSDASGSIGVNIEINGTNAQIIFAGAADGTTHDWNQESGHNISINSGSMEVGNNVNLSTDGITIASGGTLDTQYGSTVTIRGDGDSGTANFTNSGTVTNLGTIDLGTGTDTIGLAFDESQGFTHKMGNGLDGGGHIIVDMTGVGSGADWDQFNQFGKDISMGNGNVEITNRPELSLPTTPDANGNETISKQEIDEIMSLNPGENLYIETEQTKNTILTGLDNNEDTLVGGGWKAAVGKSGVETIGTNVRSHTTLYGTADDFGNIAINADGQLVNVELGKGSTLELKGSGNIGAVTGEGIFKVTGDGTGDLGHVSVKDRTDATGNNYADIDTTILVASNKATIIARNISTQFDSNISDSTVEAHNNISLGNKATITASTVTAGNDLELGNNASVTGSTLDAVHDIKLGEFATVQSGNFTAGNDMTFYAGSNVSDSVLSATNNFNFNGKVTLENTKINGGSANVTSHTMIDRNSSLALTKDLNIGTSSENGTVSVVGNSTVTAENLNMLQGSSIDVGRDSTGAAAYANADTGTVNIGNLNAQAGSTINLDPSFDQAAAIFNTKKVANNTITNNINAGKNSVFSVGFNSDQDVRDMLQKEQLLDTKTGALSKDYGSVVAFNQAIKIASTASITVDGNPEASGAPATGAANSLNLKNNGTVLLTDQAFSANGKSAAITFTDTSTPGKVTSDKGKIYLAGDFNSKDTYNLFDNGDLSGASDLKIISANGKVTGTLDKNGDFTLSLDSGGNGGSGGATPRMFGRASIPVDRMLQTAFDSTATDLGTTFLHEVTTTGKGNGIEAEHAARLAAYAGANQALINAHNISVEAVNSRLGFSDGSDIKTYSLNSNAMPQPQAQSDGDQQFYVYRGRGNLAAAKAPAQNNQDVGTLKGATVWLTPTYQKTKSDGMEAQGVSYGSDVDLTGMSIGADYTFNNNITAGAAVNFGSGSADGRDTGAGASDDFNYFGLSVYAGTTFNNIAGLNIGNVKVGGDITYTKVDSDFEADSGLTGYGKLRGSTSDSSLSLGVNASLNLNLLGFDLTPHAGLRYTNFDFNEYSVGTNKGVIANIDQDKANIFSIPVGISVGREFTAGNWSIRPSADLTLTANMGDTDFNSEAHFGSNHASLNTECMDKFTYGLSAGLELNRGNFSLGAKARYIGSSNTDEYSLSLEGSYAF